MRPLSPLRLVGASVASAALTLRRYVTPSARSQFQKEGSAAAALARDAARWEGGATSAEMFVKRLEQVAPESLDLTVPTHNKAAMQCADTLRKLQPSLAHLCDLRAKLVERKDDVPFFVHLTVILAVSKQHTSSLLTPFHCTMVFAVYGEQNRLKKKSEHPNGEDFLFTKIEQLEWLFDCNSRGTWSILVVDDGCPNDSGGLCAKQLVERQYGNTNVNVVYLKDGIEQKSPACVGLESTNDSRKGGSIQYGLYEAAKRNNLPDGTVHCVCYTDADLSTHLGQCGLLMNILVRQGLDCAVGTRRMHDSIMVKGGSRNVRGKLHAYLWKQMMPEIGYVVDTQTAFKGFKAETVLDITKSLVERKFAFDIELMLKTHLRRENSLGQCGIAWIDSEAESQSGDTENYVALLRAIATIYHAYLPADTWRDEFADFVSGLSVDSFEKLLDNCPKGIATRDAADFATYKGVSSADLAAACR